MPYVNIQVAGSLTAEQKKKISKRVCDALFEVAGKKPESTYIVYQEIDRENWSVGDILLSEQ